MPHTVSRFVKSTKVRHTRVDDINGARGARLREEPKKRFWCQTLTQRCAETERIDVVAKQAIASRSNDAFPHRYTRPCRDFRLFSRAYSTDMFSTRGLKSLSNGYRFPTIRRLCTRRRAVSGNTARVNTRDAFPDAFVPDLARSPRRALWERATRPRSTSPFLLKKTNAPPGTFSTKGGISDIHDWPEMDNKELEEGLFDNCEKTYLNS